MGKISKTLCFNTLFIKNLALPFFGRGANVGASFHPAKLFYWVLWLGYVRGAVVAGCGGYLFFTMKE